jgi:hypothetical protein
MLPKELIKLLDEAKKSVLTHLKGELILPIRRQIFRMLGEYELDSDKKIVVQSSGQKRRARLQIACVKHVMHIWNAALPGDKRIEELLTRIEDCLNGNLDSGSLRRVHKEFWTDCDNLGSHSNNKIVLASYVGYATISTAVTASTDEPLVSDYIEEDALDDDLDPYDWDATYYASMAYVGKPTWDEQDEASINKRREFWTWYVTKAVPEAYSSFSENEE